MASHSRNPRSASRSFASFLKIHGGLFGFYNAPITRTIVIACGLLTVKFRIISRALGFGLSYQEIFKQFRPWRTVSSMLAFSTMSELIIGLYLLSYFRVFERQFGSSKYAVFILFSLLVSFLLQMLYLLLLSDSSCLLSSGPYGLIFASFVPFYLYIPVTSRFQIGVRLTDKSFIYIAGLQLLLSSWKHSLIPGVCGILAGILYHANVFNVREIKFPKFISSFTWLAATQTPSRTRVLRRPRRTRRNTARQPPESSIAALVSMGFDNNSARHALIQTGNDVNLAASLLAS